jgi:hypothetical protein
MSSLSALPPAVKATNIIVLIPLDAYERLLSTCPLNSGQYKTLRNGIIIDDPQLGKAIEFLCDVALARVLHALAETVCPEAAPCIARSLQLARQPDDS